MKWLRNPPKPPGQEARTAVLETKTAEEFYDACAKSRAGEFHIISAENRGGARYRLLIIKTVKKLTQLLLF